jgi:hypothetical protein
MTKLKVRMADKEDTYKDLARIPEKYRRDSSQLLIPEGRICKVTIAGRSRLLSLRGRLHENEALIFMDASARDDLKLEVGSEYEVALREAWWFGQFLWAWRASDPLYRVAARLGLISVALGFAGILLGALSVYISIK